MSKLTIFMLTIEGWQGGDPVVTYHKTREGADAAALAFAHKFVASYDVSPIDSSDDKAVLAHVYGLANQLFEYGVDEIEVQD